MMENAMLLSTNPKKVMQSLVEFGPLSKWEIKDRTALAYPRVHEAIVGLVKKNYIQIVDERTSQKNLRMKIYGLTFKGAITHLAFVNLNHPKPVGDPGESTEGFKKRWIEENKIYYANTRELKDFLQSCGHSLEYLIFQQINWLEKNFGLIIFDLILDIAKQHTIGSPSNFGQLARMQKQEKKELMERIKTIKKFPSLRKMKMFWEKGNGNREEIEIDSMEEARIRLDQLEREISLTKKSENTLLKQSFASDFLERIVHLKRKGKEANKPLRKLAKDLLKKRRRWTTDPLERVIRQLGENRGNSDACMSKTRKNSTRKKGQVPRGKYHSKTEIKKTEHACMQQGSCKP